MASTLALRARGSVRVLYGRAMSAQTHAAASPALALGGVPHSVTVHASSYHNSVLPSALPTPRPVARNVGNGWSSQRTNRAWRALTTISTASGVVMLASATAAAEPQCSPDNPLLTDSPFPLFDQVKAEDVVPGMTQILTDIEDGLAKLESGVEPTWAGLVQPLEALSDKLARSWGTVSHLKAVQDSEALRKAVEEIQPKQVELSLKFSQSQPLYKAFCDLRDGPQWSSLTDAQKRIVDGEIRDAKLGGVGLEGKDKERFNEIQQELSKLSTKFSNNLLDATKAFSKLITDPKEVEGLPASALALAAQQAKAKGNEEATEEKGPWLFTLDMPSYIPVLTHCKNRDLRKELYMAFISRASSGDVDNTPIIEKILTLRKEKSAILGYDNHAEVSMASKMATLDRALDLLEQLRAASYDKAEAELVEVQEFAAAAGAPEATGGETLKHWDMTFWAERLKEAQYDLKEEELRPYFALPVVMDGMFALAEKLFGVTVTSVDGMAPVWNKDVRLYQVSQEGEAVAYFYLDPYSRPEEKRGGAWMDEVCGRSTLLAPSGAKVRLPIAHMVCNQSPPVGDKPSLMTFREVETMFHEFGHALQHMLTRVDEGMVAGIRGVEWDAVELPSQFMENWCYHKPTLMGIAKHNETGEPLPDELFEKLVKARTYRAASMMMRQIHFATTDLKLHSTYAADGSSSIYDLERTVAEKTCVLKPLPEDRFLCGFGHIFAGGYSAGYYSYKWAEVLSADAFSAFEEAGLDDTAAVEKTGRRFRETVLAMGGGQAPLDVFKQFRGREPSTEPLLRHSGLVAA